MNRTVGVIAEYNPFHKGHSYHLRESKRVSGADTVIAVMSGDFVQRGEPALMDKWTRAEIAVKGGVDLVIELPVVYACNNAEYFANGAVRLLNGLGCVEYVSFGSECGDVEALAEIADIVAEDNMEFNALVREGMSAGLSYPKARQNAVAGIAGEDKAALMGAPNNILGAEYLKQLRGSGSAIEPVTIKRFGPGPGEADADMEMAGACAIRDLFASGKEADSEKAFRALPSFTRSAVRRYIESGCRLMFMEDLRQLLIYAVIRGGHEGFSEILSATEGLENRMEQAVRRGGDMAGMISAIKTKRYTETRIKRLLIHTILGLKKGDMAQIYGGGIYGRILAFSPAGRELLGRVKKAGSASYPLVTNLNKQMARRKEGADIKRLIEFDIMAADVYQLASKGNIKGYYDDKFNPETKDKKGGKVK